MVEKADGNREIPGTVAGIMTQLGGLQVPVSIMVDRICERLDCLDERLGELDGVEDSEAVDLERSILLQQMGELEEVTCGDIVCAKMARLTELDAKPGFARTLDEIIERQALRRQIEEDMNFLRQEARRREQEEARRKAEMVSAFRAMGGVRSDLRGTFMGMGMKFCVFDGGESEEAGGCDECNGCDGCNLAERSPDGLAKILEQEEGRFAVAETDLAFCEGWALDFVHGPNTLPPITALAERVLLGDEKITKLDSVSWRVLMRNNLRLVAYDEGSDYCLEDGEHVLDGSFQTSCGRTIQFVGFDDSKSPVRHDMERNVFAKSICLTPSLDGIDLDIDSDGFAEVELGGKIAPESYPELEGSSGLCFETFTEILAYACVGAMNKTAGMKGSGLFIGVRDLELPEDIGDFFEGGGKLKLRILTGEIKQGKSGLKIVPFEYRFPHQKDFCRGAVATE